MTKKILITNDSYGAGDRELGQVLMEKFFHSLARNDVKPAAVMFANLGVRLACEGSPVLDDLRTLADGGVPVMSCGTCLEHLGLVDAVAVGGVGTMPEGVESMLSDGAVLTIA